MINLNVGKKLKTSEKSQEKSHGKYKPWGKKANFLISKN